MLKAEPISLGWIMQPRLFYTSEGSRPGDIELARNMIRVNEECIELVRSAGFDTIWMEDHMASRDNAHLECFTNLAWQAGRHPGLRYGTLVCGQAFRNPALLAKMAANMHLLTNARFILGIGAGNTESEHREYGYPFLPTSERLAQTEDAVRIIKELWTRSPASFNGRYYAIDNAYSAPLPDSPIPLMIGGGGDKMLRVVAQYADWWCADVGSVDSFVRKAQVLANHCADIGRNPVDIVHSQVTWISIEEDSDRAIRWDNLHIVAGNPDEVARELEAYRDAGVQHFHIRFIDYPSPAGMKRFFSKVIPRLRQK